MGVTGGNPFGFDLGTKSGESGGTLKGLDLVSVLLYSSHRIAFYSLMYMIYSRAIYYH